MLAEYCRSVPSTFLIGHAPRLHTVNSLFTLQTSKVCAKALIKNSSRVRQKVDIIGTRKPDNNIELGEWVTIPTTYAGGAKGMITVDIGSSYCQRSEQCLPDISDLDLVDRLSNGRVDLTFGR